MLQFDALVTGLAHAPIDDQERLMLDLAAARTGRSQLIDWSRQHVRPLTQFMVANARVERRREARSAEPSPTRTRS